MSQAMPHPDLLQRYARTEKDVAWVERSDKITEGDFVAALNPGYRQTCVSGLGELG